MTSTEIRIALAEWAGTLGVWYCPQCRTTLPTTSAIACPTCRTEMHKDSPDYPNCLNAVHELEKKLKDFEQIRYAMRVHEMTNAGDTFGRGANYFKCLHATASQRCEALLRTLNLWKD